MPRVQYPTPLNNVNVNRDEQLTARAWYVVLLVGFIVGCLAMLYWVFMAGAAWGPGTGATTHPAATTRATRPAPTVTPRVVPRTTRPTLPPLGTPPAIRPTPPPAPPAAITVSVPGLSEAADALKSAAEKLSQPAQAEPRRIELSGDLTVHQETERTTRRPLGQRPSGPCAEATSGERARCEAWTRALRD